MRAGSGDRRGRGRTLGRARGSPTSAARRRSTRSSRTSRRFGLHPLQSFSKAARRGAARRRLGRCYRGDATTRARSAGGLRKRSACGRSRSPTTTAPPITRALRSRRTTSSRCAPPRGSLLEAAGAPPEALDPLMRRVVDTGFELTGPIARGDWETVERHLAVDPRRAPRARGAVPRPRRGDRPHAAETPWNGVPGHVRVVRTIAEAREELAPLRGGTIGLVPTMGALHDGPSGAPARGSRRERDRRHEPLRQPDAVRRRGRPRSLSARRGSRPRTARASAGVDLVFAPSADEMYPPGFQTWVEVTEVGSILEGQLRPGHFRGVATVVLKLLAIVRPDDACTSGRRTRSRSR